MKLIRHALFVWTALTFAFAASAAECREIEPFPRHMENNRFRDSQSARRGLFSDTFEEIHHISRRDKVDPPEEGIELRERPASDLQSTVDSIERIDLGGSGSKGQRSSVLDRVQQSDRSPAQSISILVGSDRTGKGPSLTIPACKQRQQSRKIDSFLRIDSCFPDGSENREMEEVKNVCLIFSEPMVPPSEVRKEASKVVPAILDPMPDGSWRWIDPCTLVFETKSGYFPTATNYLLQVPAKTKSLNGHTIDKPLNVKFKTRKLSVYASVAYPSRFLLVSFSQPVDTSNLLKKVRCSYDGEPIALRNCTDIEVKAAAIKDASGTYKMFAPKGVLPIDDFDMKVSVSGGIKPLKGNIPSEELKETTVRFRSSLLTAIKSDSDLARHRRSVWLSVAKAVSRYCPGDDMQISFSDSIAEGNDYDKVLVSPAIENMRLYRSGPHLIISGDTQLHTNYRVTIREGFKGSVSRLKYDESLVLQVGGYPSGLISPYAAAYRFSASNAGDYVVRSINLKSIRVRAYDYHPESSRYPVPSWNYNPSSSPVFEATYDTSGMRDQIQATKVSLADVVRRGHRQLAIVVEGDSGQKASERIRRPGLVDRYQMWVQYSDLALSILPAGDQFVCCVSDSRSGAPIENAKVRHLPGGSFVRTDKLGLARIPVPEGLNNYEPKYFCAILDKDIIFSTYQGRPFQIPEYARQSWHAELDLTNIDRGEKSAFWGWVKVPTTSTENGVRNCVVYEFCDAFGKILDSGQCDLNSQGGFSGAVKVPAEAPYGEAKLKLRLVAESGETLSQHDVIAMVFKREVQSRDAFGLALERRPSRDGLVSVQASLSPGSRLFLPPLLKKFDNPVNLNWFASVHKAEFKSKKWTDYCFIDPDQSHQSDVKSKILSVAFDGSRPSCIVASVPEDKLLLSPLHFEVRAQLSGVAVNNPRVQESITLHTEDKYVGVKAERLLGIDDQRISLSTIVCDPKDRAVPSVPVEILVVDPEAVGDYSVGSTNLLAKVLLKSGSTEVVRSISVRPSRTVRVIARVVGSKTQSAVLLGEKQTPPWQSKRVKVYSDRDIYDYGDTAKVFVRTPYKTGSGVLIFNTNDSSRSIFFDIANGVADVEMPINSDQRTVVSAIVKVWEREPSIKSGSKNGGLSQKADSVKPELSALVIRINKRQDVIISLNCEDRNLCAGAKHPVVVSVKKNDGSSVSKADVVLKLGPLNYSSLPADSSNLYNQYAGDAGYPRLFSTSMLPDHLSWPLSKLSDSRATFSSGLSSHHGWMNSAGPLYCMLQEKIGEGTWVSPILQTDANGELRVDIKIPAASGKYRLVAEVVAENGCASGFAYTDLTAYSPLEMALNAPEFVYRGDKVTSILKVKNNFAEDIDLSIKIKRLDKRESNQKLLAQSSVQLPGKGIKTICLEHTEEYPDGFEVLASSQGNRQRLPVSFKVKPLVDANYCLWFNETSALGRSARVLLSGPKGAKLMPTTVIVGNSLMGQLILSAQDWCQADIYTVDQRSARLLFLSHLMFRFSDRIEPALKSKIKTCISLDSAELTKVFSDRGEHASWFPRGECNVSIDSFPALILAESMAGLNREQNLNVDLSNVYVQTSGFQNIYNFPNELARKYEAYAKYIGALVSESVAEDQREHFRNVCVESMERSLQSINIAKLNGEELGWLFMASRRLPIAEGLKTRLNNRLSDCCVAPGQHKVWSLQRRGLQLGSSSAYAVLLTALLEDRENRKGHRDAAKMLLSEIEKRMEDGRFDAPTARSIALRAMIDFEAAYPELAVEGKLRSEKGKTVRFQKGEPQWQVREFYRAGEVDNVLQITPGLRVGILSGYSKKLASAAPENAGFALRRSIVPADRSEKFWTDQQGNLHCLEGAKLVVKLDMVPSKVAAGVHVRDRISAGLKLCEPYPQQDGSSPTWYDTPMWEAYHLWLECLEIGEEEMNIYVDALGPRLYKMEYYVEAPNTGEFVIPPVEAETVYNKDMWGTSGSQRLIVHPR